MKAAILYSGGKDSTYTAYLAQKMGHEVVCLITVIPSVESYLFHYPNAHMTYLQAKAMGVPILKYETKGIEEKEMYGLRHALQKAIDQFKVQEVFTGGIASKYQKERFGKVCHELSLENFNPLWDKNPQEYMKELIKLGFEIMIVGVSALGLDRSWLGRVINHQVVDELIELNKRFEVHVAFEGGDAETYVTDSPLFKRKIEVIQAEEHWKGDYGYLQIRKARLVMKHSAPKTEVHSMERSLAVA